MSTGEQTIYATRREATRAGQFADTIFGVPVADIAMAVHEVFNNQDFHYRWLVCEAITAGLDRTCDMDQKVAAVSRAQGYALALTLAAGATSNLQVLGQVQRAVAADTAAFIADLANRTRDLNPAPEL